jgi:hypothetical protein
MKHGANFKDRNRIAELAHAGLDAGEISARLQIKRECVESFMPGAKKKAAEPKPVEPTFDFTEESLQAVATESGMAGLREIADPHGIKGNSKEKVIEALLEAKAKHENPGE